MIMDGKSLSEEIKNDLRNEIGDLIITLAVVIVGDDPASHIYVRNKKIACDFVGIKSEIHELNEKTTQSELLKLIDHLNNRRDINGILVQIPLPKQINEHVIMQSISPLKDVDGFSPINIGMLTLGSPRFIPCTPLGIITLLDYYSIDISGKNCVVLGRSNDVGKPIAAMLMSRNGTVTVCHSRTQNLAWHTSHADILVSSIGKPKFVTQDIIKPGAVIIDVGMNRIDNKLCGDVDFENCKDVASFITPVPGGVGPMTIAMLMKNCLQAYKLQN